MFKLFMTPLFKQIKYVLTENDNEVLTGCMTLNYCVNIQSILAYTNIIINMSDDIIGELCRYIVTNNIKNMEFVFDEEMFIQEETNNTIVIGYGTNYHAVNNVIIKGTVSRNV